MTERHAFSVETSILNKDMRIFLHFTPRFYYVVPWRLRFLSQRTIDLIDRVGDTHESDDDCEARENTYE